MKEQGRQYQATVFLAVGHVTKQFKSKKKAETWAKTHPGRITHRVETVK